MLVDSHIVLSIFINFLNFLARYNSELEANNAKELWLSVQNLNQIVKTKSESMDSDALQAELKLNIQRIVQSAGNNQFIKDIVQSIPIASSIDKLSSEPLLKERFFRLKDVCKRVALIDNRGGSLFKYFISYLQSFFILNNTIGIKSQQLNKIIQYLF